MAVVRQSAFAALFLVCALVSLTGASPPTGPAAEDLIRKANDEYARKEYAKADKLYQAAEVLTNDPGLVAFNRAAVHFQEKEYTEAERYYVRVLNDAACPPERAANAWYNLGTSLIKQPSATSRVFDRAIDCFERCLESPAADAALKANARHNLVLAKLLWKKAYDEETAAGKKPPTPNDPRPPEDEPRLDPKDKSQGAEPQDAKLEPGNGTEGAQTPKVVPIPSGGTGAKEAASNDAAAKPGPTATLQPLEDRRDIRPMSPEETREHLRITAERLKRDRQNLRMTLYGPERTGQHDW